MSAFGFDRASAISSFTLRTGTEGCTTRIEGPIAMTMCSGSDGPSECALDANCRVKPHMGIVSNAVRGALGAVSLQQLSSPAKANPKQENWTPAFAGERAGR